MSLEKKTPAIDTVKVGELTSSKLVHLPSGFPNFDRVFQGGFLLLFVYFIVAERGAGKTTFLLQVCSYLVSLGKSVVFFSFDESKEGINKKCLQYHLIDSQPYFVAENIPGIIERTILERKPDFVVIDSLQSLAEYKADEITGILYRLRKEAQKHKFALVVVSEERKDKTNYLGSASNGHIVDVQMRMEVGLNEEVIISTPDKNRDTDDKTSRSFFKRTPAGLVEIQETETGYLPRHRDKTVVGLAGFVTRDGNDFSVDEITAAFDRNTKKASLTIAGMSQAKTKNLLAILYNTVAIIDVGITLRANHTEKMLSDAELACMVAALSLLLGKPVPVDTIFIGGVDNRGYLIPIDGMMRRVKRAKALGYKRIIGPVANGSQTAIWEERETLVEVWEKCDA
jgi:DNA repair protein RadA/Sms